MQQLPLGAVSGAAGVLSVGLVFVWGLVMAVFWMVCGWRAMRAHERLADSVERLVTSQSDGGRGM